MLDRLDDLLKHYEEIQAELSEPSVAQDADRFRMLMKELNDLTPLADAYRSYIAAISDEEDSLHLLEEESDEELRELAKDELADARKRRQELKEEIRLLHDYLKNNEYTLDELNAELYAIPKKIFGEDAADLKKLQGAFFKNVYKLLLDKEKGPRLYLFLFAIDKESYVRLLDFSTEKTEDEIMAKQREAEAALAAEEAEKVVYGDPDPVQPVKDEVNIEEFQKLDLRVCKVLKCQEIRKSHSCYKLTLDDGLDKRVIVSSIKQYYKPEELEGKKIIVVANLAEARITGVTSQGMLLAGTNNACGCKVIFVDDMVPVGARIC